MNIYFLELFAFFVSLCLVAYVVKNVHEGWRRYGLISLVVLPGTWAAYLFSEVVFEKFDTLLKAMYQFNTFSGLCLMAGIVLVVMTVISVGAAKFFHLQSRVALSVLYGAAVMLSSAFVVKILVNNAPDEVMSQVLLAVLVVYIIIAGRINWHRGLQDRASILIGTIANLLLTYALFWYIGWVGSVTNLTGSWQAMIPSLLVYAPVYLRDIIFGEKRIDQQRAAYKLNKIYSGLLFICFSVLILFQLAGVIDQNEVMDVQFNNEAKTALVEIARDELNNRKIGGHTRAEQNEALKAAKDNKDSEKIKLLIKIGEERERLGKKIDKQEASNLDILERIKKYPVLFLESIFDRIDRFEKSLIKSQRVASHGRPVGLTAGTWKTITVTGRSPVVVRGVRYGDEFEYRRVSHNFTCEYPNGRGVKHNAPVSGMMRGFVLDDAPGPFSTIKIYNHLNNTSFTMEYRINKHRG